MYVVGSRKEFEVGVRVVAWPNDGIAVVAAEMPVHIN